ncbi:VWD domain-containing protein [Bradyrhizobium diazoefficiens]|nr:VWD domain-containing protein [Bradyrhizobium diazoefficiens]MBR0851715.1 VWD domain-containing protein [Bradyrhizobium diazoefficiens]
MSKRRLLEIFAALVALVGVAGALQWLWQQTHKRTEPPPVVKAESVRPPEPEPEPVRGLIHEVDERDVASSNGDVHIRTADGAYYDFQLVGEFVALRSDSNDLEVQVRQRPWQGSSRTVSTNTAVAVGVAGDRVSFGSGSGGGLYVNGKATQLAAGEAMALPKGGKIGVSNGALAVIWPDESEVRIVPHGTWLDVVVELVKSRAGHVAGLFGNFDGDPKNDVVARDGTRVELSSTDAKELRRKLYDVFGQSWRLRQSESLFDYAAGESTATFTDLKFPYEIVTTASLETGARARAEEICKRAGSIAASFLDSGILDVVVTGDAGFTESALKLQESVKLPEGFQCQDMASGGDKCTNYEPSLANARVGSPFRIDLDTMTGDVKGTESFDCTLVDAARRASCTIRTRGKVFAGAVITTRYTLDSGEVREEKGTMERR